jgi:AP-3 complex subunit delta-1
LEHLFFSELAEPQKLLPFLVTPDISKLAADTVAVYVQGAAKIFSFWAVDLAEHWEDDNLQAVKTVVNDTMHGLLSFASSAESEVQERVRDAFIIPYATRTDTDHKIP